MLKLNGDFTRGMTDGVPIMLGYLSVSFAFGIYCVSCGLDIWQATIISAVNVTSAGQLAGVGVMAVGGSLLEMATTQLVINLRYALMSVSLSQKLDKNVRVSDRFWISFMITDEIFAVSSGRDGNVSRVYMAGLALPPFIGWTLGTLLGSVMGNVLPPLVISALGIAIYGMFIAIIIPPSKKRKPVAGAVLMSVAMSCAFKYIPALSGVSSGFAIIICAVTAGALFAALFPVEEKEGEQ